MSSEGERPEYGSVSGRHAAEKRPLTSVKTRQEHIAHIAKKYTGSPLTTLSHHLDRLWMGEAFRQVKKDSAPGVDGVSVEAYAQNLETNLADLLERAKSGRYRPSPVKRAYIPKNEKEMRPIGLPTVESKVLERAVVMLLEPLYEQDFLECSFGFRPNRSPHHALDGLRRKLVEVKGGWVLDVDVRKYFDSIPHQQLMQILRLRVEDSVILRLIAKWLKAGIWEEGIITTNTCGTPQGGVISPLLSNIFLHEVLDVWFEHTVKPRLKGPAHLVRFADDFVMVFGRLDEAHRVLEVLPKRLGKYGLDIHEQKTRLVDFRHPWVNHAKPETFDFLGFTHYWGKTRKGGMAIKAKTSSKKLRLRLKEIAPWCKRHAHANLKWQHAQLCLKLQGHYAYYGVIGNSRAMNTYRYHVIRIWHYWLNRRSRQRDGMKWPRFLKLLEGILRLPEPRIVHAVRQDAQLWGNL